MSRVGEASADAQPDLARTGLQVSVRYLLAMRSALVLALLLEGRIALVEETQR